MFQMYELPLSRKMVYQATHEAKTGSSRAPGFGIYNCSKDSVFIAFFVGIDSDCLGTPVESHYNSDVQFKSQVLHTNKIRF